MARDGAPRLRVRLPSPSTRLEILEEQLEIVHRSWAEGSFDFHGRHYQTERLDALPKPLQRPHPNLIVGGSGGTRSVTAAARWADEYNTVFATPWVCRQRRAAVDRAWEEAGRDPATLVFSVMTGCVVGRSHDDVRRRASAVLRRLADGPGPVGDDWRSLRAAGWVIGTVEEVVEQLRELEDAGVQRVMLQHLAHDDLAPVWMLGEVAARAI